MSSPTRPLRSILPFVPPLLLLIACAPVQVPTQAPPAAAPRQEAAPAAPAAPQPRAGGVLHFAPWSPPRGLDYCKDASGFGAEAWVPVYEGLLSYDYKVGEDYRKDLRVVPYLAERWEQVNDTAYLFHLRKGVRWHDGQELAADDVVFSFPYIADSKNACGQRANLVGLKSVEKVDQYTVRITTENPMAPFLENMALRESVIFPRHLAEAGTLFKSESTSVGTGPMRVKSFDRNEKTAYAGFKDYWGGKPNLDGGVAFYGTDRSARAAAFVAKQLDILTVSDKAQFDGVRTQVPEARGEGFPTSHGYAMYLRVDRPPLNDVRVRRAIHLALNRQEMEKTLAFGAGRVNPPGVSAVSAWAIPEAELLKLPGYNPAAKPQDLAEARRLLKEAGHGDGLSLAIQAVAPWDNPRIAEVAARQLKEIGIDLKLDFIESGLYFANQAKGDFQIQLNGMSSDFIDKSLVTYFYSGAGGNYAHVADPELDRLIEKQRATFDRQERFKVLRQIQELLLDKLWMVPTIELGFFWIDQPYVHEVINARSTGVNLFRGGKIWLDEKAPQRSLP